MGEFFFEHINLELQRFVVASEGEELLLGGDEDLLEGGVWEKGMGNSGGWNDL